ncbi:MAG: hypothetical protein AAF411_04445 [Myxococcota bacterium]
MNRTALWAAAWVTLLGVSCTGTPMPAPPIEPPPPPDPGRILIEEPQPTSPGSLTGQPGAVDAGLRLSVLYLDGTGDAVVIEPEADGSFFVEIDMGVTRLETIDEDGVRSAPVDLDGQGVVEVALPCLLVPSPVVTPGELELENTCAESVGVELRLRRAGSFDVMEGPLELAPAETRTIAVGTGAAVDALFVEVQRPIVERRAATLE